MQKEGCKEGLQRTDAMNGYKEGNMEGKGGVQGRGVIRGFVREG